MTDVVIFLSTNYYQLSSGHMKHATDDAVTISNKQTSHSWYLMALSTQTRLDSCIVQNAHNTVFGSTC